MREMAFTLFLYNTHLSVALPYWLYLGLSLDLFKKNCVFNQVRIPHTGKLRSNKGDV